jgi:hypothetical protein
MNRLAGFSAIAAANATRAKPSVRQIASVSSPYTRLSGLGDKRQCFARSELFRFDTR